MPSVLVADHEPEVAELARRYLERAGLRVLLADGPADTIRALAGRGAQTPGVPETPDALEGTESRSKAPGAPGVPDAPDLFVIDLTMPGLEVRAVRHVLPPAVPAVFLLHRGEPRPHGLNSPPAARRWLARPFSPRALVVAVAELAHPVAGLRRPPGHGAADGRHEIALNGRDVSLTRTEYALVTALAAQPGRVLSRRRLLTALESERGKRPSPRAVDVYIAQLRGKLGPAAIRTVHGVGYVLDFDGAGALTQEQREGMPEALLRQTPGGPPRPRPGGG